MKVRGRRTHGHINRKHRKSHKRERIPPLTPLRPIAQRQHEAHQQQTDVGVLQNRVDHFDCGAADHVGVFERVGEDEEGDEEVALLFAPLRHCVRPFIV